MSGYNQGGSLDRRPYRPVADVQVALRELDNYRVAAAVRLLAREVIASLAHERDELREMHSHMCQVSVEHQRERDSFRAKLARVEEWVECWEAVRTFATALGVPRTETLKDCAAKLRAALADPPAKERSDG